MGAAMQSYWRCTPCSGTLLTLLFCAEQLEGGPRTLNPCPSSWPDPALLLLVPLAPAIPHLSATHHASAHFVCPAGVATTTRTLPSSAPRPLPSPQSATPTNRRACGSVPRCSTPTSTATAAYAWTCCRWVSSSSCYVQCGLRLGRTVSCCARLVRTSGVVVARWPAVASGDCQWLQGRSELRPCPWH